MRAIEFINEANMSRRGFLGALGAGAAIAAAPNLAQAGQHQSWSSWKDEKTTRMWDNRWKKLSARMDNVVKKLFSVMPPEQKKALQNINFEVGDTSKYGYYNLAKNKLVIDLTTYWDLTDDTLAYCVAHELGHAFYKHGGYSSDNNQNRKDELMADAFGAKLAYKAGYDPNKCFTDMTNNRDTAGTATHPGYQQRVDYVKKQTGIPVAHIQRGMQLINTPLTQIAQA